MKSPDAHALSTAQGAFPNFLPTTNENATRRWRKSLIPFGNLGGRCRF